MKSLAAYIVSGRWQAVAVTATCGLLALLLLPLGCLGAAAIALVTLHVGIVSGLQVLVLAAAAVMVLYLLTGVQLALGIVIVLLLWFPAWLAAAALQQTREPGVAIKTAVLFGMSLLLLVYAGIQDPAATWLEILRDMLAMFGEMGVRLRGVSDELLQELAAQMTGVLLSWLALAIIASLLLGRWWQSLLVRPGAFGQEFRYLRLCNLAGLLTLAMMLLASFTSGKGGEIITQLAMIMLVAYLLTGLALLHSLVKQAGRGSGWLVAAYLLLAFVPQTLLLLAAVGLLDTWVDLRRRFGRRQQGD